MNDLCNGNEKSSVNEKLFAKLNQNVANEFLPSGLLSAEEDVYQLRERDSDGTPQVHHIHHSTPALVEKSKKSSAENANVKKWTARWRNETENVHSPPLNEKPVNGNGNVTENENVKIESAKNGSRNLKLSVDERNGFVLRMKTSVAVLRFRSHLPLLAEGY
jgi:hypothetical protein